MTDRSRFEPPDQTKESRHASPSHVRRAGSAIAIAGALLLAYVALVYGRGVLARDAARTRWSEMQVSADARRAYATASGGAAGVTDAPRGAPVARLRISSIALDEVVVEGVDVRSLNAGPGHLPGSALPGAVGNAVLSAHRDRHFAKLGQLSVGDTVVTETPGDSAPTRWIVSARRVVRAGAPALYRTSTPTLTLTTCWPIGYLGGAPERLLVTAVPVGPVVSR